MRASVALGIDAFDSTFPHALGEARHAAHENQRRVNVRNAENKARLEPPCFECGCPLCSRHTLAYLHHLDRAREPMAWTLATEHNLWYMGDLMREVRGKIRGDEL